MQWLWSLFSLVLVSENVTSIAWQVSMDNFLRSSSSCRLLQTQRKQCLDKTQQHLNPGRACLIDRAPQKCYCCYCWEHAIGQVHRQMWCFVCRQLQESPCLVFAVYPHNLLGDRFSKEKSCARPPSLSEPYQIWSQETLLCNCNLQLLQWIQILYWQKGE